MTDAFRNRYQCVVSFETRRVGRVSRVIRVIRNTQMIEMQ